MTTIMVGLVCGKPIKLKPDTTNQLHARQMAPPSSLDTSSPSTDETLFYRNQGQPDRVQFGQCIPLEKKGDPVKFAKFARPASCYGYKDNLCTEPVLPVPFLLPANVPLDNPLNLGSIVVGSYLCRSLADDPLLKPVTKNALALQAPVISEPEEAASTASSADGYGDGYGYGYGGGSGSSSAASSAAAAAAAAAAADSSSSAGGYGYGGGYGGGYGDGGAASAAAAAAAAAASAGAG
ncbi:unnamed protein product [Absidia cylindrospora]